MDRKIEVVPVIVPTGIIQVNMQTEDVIVQFFNVDTAARKALMNLALDMAKQRLLDGETDDGPASA